MPVLKPLSMDAQGNQSKRYEDTQKEVSKMRDTDDKKININLSSQNSLDKENREASQENSYPLNTAGRKDIESFDSFAKSNELTNNPTIKEESEENNLTEEKMASNMTVQEDTILEKEPQPHTKSGSQEILSTPNQKTLTMKSSPTCFSQSGIKNSPNTSLQVTDIMIEEEEKYKLEDEQQMEKVKAEILDELERTGKQERYQRLQNLLSKSQTYSTYLLGRINDRREKEKKAAEREEKRKLNEEQRKQGKDEKQKLLESQNRREVRGKQIKVEDEQSEEANTNSRKKKRKSEAEETGHRAKKTRGGAKSKVADFDEKSATTFGDTDGTIDQPDEIGRMYNGEKVPEAQPKLMTGGVLRQYQIEGMEWLTGLFENGINGILADEMGLGKTLQSIALIARLIEQKVIGPFLIAAPLSTLPNWIAEFKRFAPQIYTILYHGSKEERMEKRRKLMRIKKYSHGLCSLPVVITSYEIVMRDRVALSSFNVEWKYLIVDEGHRLKNLNCKLIRELKLYDTGNRLLLTGTPLQNDLAELWSLLNFLLPDIFDDLSSFQRWFDFSAMSSSEFIAHEQETNVLQTLHSILTPFLLRRLKSDVDLSIPPKKEVLVRCPMTVQQQNYYKTTLDRSVLDMIAKKTETKEVTEFTAGGRPKRKSTQHVNYNLSYFDDDDDDEVYFDFEALVKEMEAVERRKEEERNKKNEKNSIVNIKLQNIMMMLRKCCNHPYLLEYPFDPKTDQLIIDERLLHCSGKLLMMDKMLEGLKERGHKVLIFSQMTQMLDIIVDYLDMKNWSYSRLDGTMKVEDRFQNIEKFNTDPDRFIFLLSTRAGGLGLNLMMADTCIIYDSDWNPQVDLQAQDRCHRIGQKKPVVIYRLVTANTIDQRIIERAAQKRKLEKMVIHEKRFKGRAESKRITPTELLTLLETSDIAATLGTEDVITDEELNKLLDRNDLKKIMEKQKSKTAEEPSEDVVDDQLPSTSDNKLFTVLETCITEQVVI